MKVKIFDRSVFEGLKQLGAQRSITDGAFEISINNFLNTGVEVKMVKQSGESPCISIWYEEKPQTEKPAETVFPSAEEKMAKLLATSVSRIEFDGMGKYINTRIHLKFIDAEIENLGQLVGKSADELLKYRNFGKRCLNVVREKLSEFGLHLKGEGPGE